MQGEDIIIFSSDDWGWKTSKYQLSIRFAEANRVLFVSSIGFRAPTASSGDLRRIFRKLMSFFRGLDRKSENLYVLTPLVIPFRRFPLIGAINRWMLRLQLQYAKRKLGIVSPYLFVFSQNWYDYIGKIAGKKLVYYCVDEHSGFSGIAQERFERQDRLMSEKADLILCSSRTLFEKNRARNRQTHYLPHGVNFELFATALDENLPIAPDIKRIDPPIILFFGHVSYDWVDHDLVKALARSRTDWSFVMLGRYSMAPEEFSDTPNVHLLGERPFEALPSYCRGADLGIIPFVDSELTRNCNPLKLFEYLAAGLQVVSSDIPEVRQYADSVYIARGAKEFQRAIEQALGREYAAAARALSESMADESWDNRVERIYQLLTETPATSDEEAETQEAAISSSSAAN